MSCWVDSVITMSVSSTNAVRTRDVVFCLHDALPIFGGGFVAAAGETVTSSLTGPGAITGGTCTGAGTTDLSGQRTDMDSTELQSTSNLLSSLQLKKTNVPLTRPLVDGNGGSSAKPTM